MLAIETVAVVGATEAGTACAVLASLAGCAVRFHDPALEALDLAFEAVRRKVELALAAGAITPSERQRILDGVLFTPDLEEALTATDLLVEADARAPEERLARLSDLLRASAAVAAAGATAPSVIAARVSQPGRVLALRLADAHGPVPRLEVAPVDGTSPHVIERAEAFVQRVNRAARVARGS
ncbi:MAG TPA: 3-hydroxyacyl-CoA dehydrogenase NAD-binding domain-containing protein [Anaeromyxobacter sp.]|nr:3-hydroxyacyl-CoA dehydrogenase NAD-binding domain-containing protein [Anaeromyxobacter sp.]